MSNKFRKVLAAILAGTMVLGSGVVANAAEGSGKGTGSVDVVEAEDIFSVVLPTSAGTQFNYILDPTGVIAKTNFEKYGGTASASFIPNQTMYFRQQPASGSNVATYSNISDPIKAYNKSTMAVEIQVKAHLATSSGIIIATSSVAGSNLPGTVAATATPSIYLALTPDGGTKQEAITTTDKVVATASIGDAKANYKVTYASDSDTYNTELATGSNAKTDAERDAAGFQSYSFSLMGDCNPDGKWIGLTENPPEVTLVWKINKPDGAVEVTDGPQVSISTSGLVKITGLTGKQNFKSMRIYLADGSDWDVDDAQYTPDVSGWSAENGGEYSVQLEKPWTDFIKSKGGTAKAKLTLTDNSIVWSTVVTIQ